ncbi:hypothetical protein [Moheibacter sediminis]|uniref:Uncharacterized protein n=1 Tax=Moheibacter sediminis TaxID=1434700 RepID=A0A1W2BCP0_9FLAO|nr:hypothetical protein [Moheibacter sediminis]SMC70482.1 hypothetical protein SAMN06296427_10650 [Moheibacter sediminis]
MTKFSDIELFDLLKKDITKHFFESNSASSYDISEWKGQDIVTFQEDLFARTKSTVSEKWFYTYFKSDFKKLPRIDMLNILAQYAGHTNWAAFSRSQNNNYVPETPVSVELDVIPVTTEADISQIEDKIEAKIINPPKKKGKYAVTAAISILILGIFGAIIYYSFFYQRTYEFCFIDSDRNTSIKDPIEITILRKGFTPLQLVTNNGCIQFSSMEDTLQMYVSSPYHKLDTFKINLHQYQNKENIRLEPDDYKVMLRHYSKSSQSVKERIKMLNEMIADDALIYQVYDNEFFGVEVLSKKQYINLVSLPTSSLKNFTLIEAERKNGKIVKLKFKIHSDES